MFPLKDNLQTRRFPILTVLLIVANVVMFFGFQGAFVDDAEFDRKVVEYGAIPYEISHPGKQCAVAEGSDVVVCEGQESVEGEAPSGLAPTWLTLLTSMFMHGGLLHLGGNMLFLWVFGNSLEDSMSRPRFILFYLLGGIVALLAQTAIDPNAAVPTIGASGAVAAVLGAYALLYPRARVITVIFIVIFFTAVELPAMLLLGAWFVLQALSALASLSQPVGEAGGGVAFFAHIGGFLFGLAVIRLFANHVHEEYESAHRTPVY